MVYNSLPIYIHTIIATSAYQWDNDNKSDTEVCAYFDNLLMISRLSHSDKGNLKPPAIKKITYNSKKNSFNKKFTKRKPSS